MKSDEYSVTKTFANQSDIINLKEIVESVRTKVRITESIVSNGTKIDFIGASKVFVDYVLWEVDKLSNMKKALNAELDQEKSANGNQKVNKVEYSTEEDCNLSYLDWNSIP